MSDTPKKNQYWTIEQEEAVRKYLSLEPDSKEANDVFERFIYEPLKHLIENIMFTYSLAISEIPVQDQIYDVLGYVMYKFDKFNPELGNKAFSYYGTVAKNYMIVLQNKTYANSLKITEIDKIDGCEKIFGLFEENQFDIDHNSYGFMFTYAANYIEKQLETNLDLNVNVYKVGEIVVYLLKNYTKLEIANKKQFYCFAREFTGLNAKEITAALKKIKSLFVEASKTLQ